jgi:hypothetical protein
VRIPKICIKHFILIFLKKQTITTYNTIKMKLTTCLFIAFALASCGGKKKEGLFDKIIKEANNKTKEVSSEPQNVDISDIFNPENNYERNETLVFVGYIGQVPSTVSMSGGKMNIKIYERRNQTLGEYVNVGLSIGTGENEVESLPEKYKQEDLHVYADDKTKLGVGDKIRVTATDIYISTGYYSVEGYTIEKVDEKNIEEAFKDAIALTSAIIHDTSVHEIYGYMDGVLSIPSVFYTMNDFLGLKIKTTTNKDFETVDVHLGQGPSTMDALPSSYTPKDLKVRDSNGDLIGAGKKVRIYGTWQRYGFVSSTGLGGQFKTEEIVVL